MKGMIPRGYVAFRTAWTVLHVLIVAVGAYFLVRWGITDDNAVRLYRDSMDSLFGLQRAVSQFIPFPWS